MRNGAILLVLLAIIGQGASAQAPAPRNVIPVYVDWHLVKDETGHQFVLALRRALSNSQGHDLGAADVDDRRLRFYLEVVTIDLGSTAKTEDTSIASIMIEDMRRPNSYPVAEMWYHKAFPLKRSKLDELARQFVADMDARWCNHIKSSVGNCPKEFIPRFIRESTALIGGKSPTLLWNHYTHNPLATSAGVDSWCKRPFTSIVADSSAPTDDKTSAGAKPQALCRSRFPKLPFLAAD